MDIVPASGRDWDGTAKKAAEDLGWVESCGSSGGGAGLSTRASD
jgi:hypothetical protein